MTILEENETMRGSIDKPSRASKNAARNKQSNRVDPAQLGPVEVSNEVVTLDPKHKRNADKVATCSNTSK